MFSVTAIDETWGTGRIVNQASFSTYADMKAIICRTVEEAVKDCAKLGVQHRTSTIVEIPGEVYKVVFEWCPDGNLIPSEFDNANEGYPGEGLQCAVVMEGKVTE